MLTWLFFGLLGMGLYKQHIYDHYFGFLFPAIFLMAAWVIVKVADFHRGWRYFGGFLFLLITILSFKESPLRYSPNYQMDRVREIDLKILEEARDRPYNFALIAKQNYEAGYEYFLEEWGKGPLAIDPQKFSQTVTDQLFVVCEDAACEPTTNSKVGIANFGWSRIESQWELPWGVRLFKLVHLQKDEAKK